MVVCSQSDKCLIQVWASKTLKTVYSILCPNLTHSSEPLPQYIINNLLLSAPVLTLRNITLLNLKTLQTVTVKAWVQSSFSSALVPGLGLNIYSAVYTVIPGLVSLGLSPILLLFCFKLEFTFVLGLVQNVEVFIHGLMPTFIYSPQFSLSLISPVKFYHLNLYFYKGTQFELNIYLLHHHGPVDEEIKNNLQNLAAKTQEIVCLVLRRSWFDEVIVESVRGNTVCTH